MADFLEQEKDLPWPVQYRALEALGALRQASTTRPAKGQPEMATTAMRFLADPEARPEVRAEAGLGPGHDAGQRGRSASYNFPLIAYNIGELAADARRADQRRLRREPDPGRVLTGLLVTQVYQAFERRRTGVRDSGLLKARTRTSARHRDVHQAGRRPGQAGRQGVDRAGPATRGAGPEGPEGPGRPAWRR